MNGREILNCRNLNFLEGLTQQRLKQFQNIIDPDSLKRMLCFNFFLLGAKRKSLSKALNIPEGTVRSFIRSVRLKGIAGLEDRRRKHSSFLPSKEDTSFQASLDLDNENIFIHFRNSKQKLKIPRENTLQVKVILLTFLKSGLLSKKEVSKAIDVSESYTQILAQKLLEEDVQALIDKRQGQKDEYVFKPEIKAEMIQQYIANLVSGKKISSQVLSEDLNVRCDFELPSRTIRAHIEKLGLSKIKTTLPELIASLKKTPKTHGK